MITLENVSVNRGRRTILHNVSCTIPNGKLVALVGENGAGKSTLIHTIAGNLPFQGNIDFLDLNLKDWTDSALARHRAVMTQQNTINFELSVPELIAMGRFPILESEQKKQQRVMEFIDYLSLQPLAQRHTGQLSGGELQRVNIAKSFAQLDAFSSSACPQGSNHENNNKLLLLDEPTSALDLNYQHHLMQLIRCFIQTGNSAIVAIHDLNLASLYADDVLLLNAGELVLYDTKNSVLTPDLLEPVYGTHMHIQPHPNLDIPMIFSQPKESSSEHFIPER